MIKLHKQRLKMYISVPFSFNMWIETIEIKNIIFLSIKFLFEKKTPFIMISNIHLPIKRLRNRSGLYILTGTHWGH